MNKEEIMEKIKEGDYVDETIFNKSARIIVVKLMEYKYYRNFEVSNVKCEAIQEKEDGYEAVYQADFSCDCSDDAYDPDEYVDREEWENMFENNAESLQFTVEYQMKNDMLYVTVTEMEGVSVEKTVIGYSLV